MEQTFVVKTLSERDAEGLRAALLKDDVFSIVQPLDLEVLAKQAAALLAKCPKEQQADVRKALDRAIDDALSDTSRAAGYMTPSERIAQSIDDMKLHYGSLYTWRSGRCYQEAEVSLTMPRQLWQAVRLTSYDSWRRITLEELELLLMPQLQHIPSDVYGGLLGVAAPELSADHYRQLIELACGDEA